MKFFKRNQEMSENIPAMPPELSDYYHAEKRQHALVTWGLGFATLAVTIAMAFGLFVGARWLVNKVRHEPVKQPVATQNNPEPASTEAPASGATATTGSSPTQPVASSSVTTPQTSSATTNLPNTGPANTLVVFLVATSLGTFAYRVTSRR